MQETPAPLLGREDPLEEGKAPHPLAPCESCGDRASGHCPLLPLLLPAAPQALPPQGVSSSCARAPPGCCPPLAGAWLQPSFVCPGGWLVLVPCSRVFHDFPPNLKRNSVIRYRVLKIQRNIASYSSSVSVLSLTRAFLRRPLKPGYTSGSGLLSADVGISALTAAWRAVCLGTSCWGPLGGFRSLLL